MDPVNKRWRNAGLYTAGVVVIALGTAFLTTPEQETWRYSQFIQEVEKGRVEQSVSVRTGQGFGYAMDGEKKIVNLPNDPELIDLLTKNNVDISVLPQSDEGFWFKALAVYFFPVLL